MSTGNMPNPPDMPTESDATRRPAGPKNAATSTSAATTPGGSSPPPSAPAFSLAEDIAGIIESNADILAQRLIYHSQTMLGRRRRGRLVNARNPAMVLANALRNNADTQAEEALLGVGVTCSCYRSTTARSLSRTTPWWQACLRAWCSKRCHVPTPTTPTVSMRLGPSWMASSSPRTSPCSASTGIMTNYV